MEFERVLPHHKCTEEDFAEFSPIVKHQENFLQKVKNDSEYSLYCLDWDSNDPFVIYGTSDDQDH